LGDEDLGAVDPSPWTQRGRSAVRAFLSVAPSRYRRIRSRLRVAAEALGFLLLLSVVAGRGNGPTAPAFDRAALVWVAGLLLLATATYVHEVGVARRLLRKTVSPERLSPRPLAPSVGDEPRDELPTGALDLTIDDYDPLTLRGRSLFQLALGFRAVLAGLPTQADAAVREIDRADLGPWESRVLESVRTLSALASGDRQRAARLAPLALETGHPEVDRLVAVALVRAAWHDAERLLAVSKALSLGGADAVALGRLAEVRVRDLGSAKIRGPRVGEGAPGATSLEAFADSLDAATLRQISEDAREVGDPGLAERLLARAEGSGLYR
jgi:hypothetical protein